jgi:BirA family biotin operon repressor/biotin-[acetyl-CoA-carboxylase] ligase
MPDHRPEHLPLAACVATLNQAAEAVWPDMAQTLAEHPEPAMAGFTVEVVPSIDSTNAELMRRARSGPHGQAPTLLVAADQTAGRGRMGKTWLSQPGHSLTFSLLLPMQPTHWAGLSLAVGVSVADALGPLLPPAVGERLRLKWPNDLWLDGAKLAGILVETAHLGAGACVVVGVGINTEAPVPDPTAAWTGVPPTGLAAHTTHPGGLDAGAVLRAVAPALLRDLLAFEALGFSAFAQRFAQRDALRDQALVLSDGTQGTGCGVDEQGALLVLTARGVQPVHSADVSVRPVPNLEAPL